MALVDYSSSDSASEAGSPRPSVAKSRIMRPTAPRSTATLQAPAPAEVKPAKPIPIFPMLRVKPTATQTCLLFRTNSMIFTLPLFEPAPPMTPIFTKVGRGLSPILLAIGRLTSTLSHSLLAAFLDKIKPLLGLQKLYPLLTSDLNAPLPLHISLSRPLSLTTAQKDAFFSSLKSSLPSATGDFTVSPRGIGFFKSPDSDRAFLVLRVADPDASRNNTSTSGKNPQLRALLTKCNAIALRFGHPALYQAHATELVDDAFHMSIGWTFGLPPEDACLQTYALLRQPEFRGIREWKIEVSGSRSRLGM
ncbi:U6 snRNA-associated Sm-like protein LSm1 [Colletotrichum spaethianum]|uniref:U6 snRNA phosphodiesterase 1 n=1 Tax=Colletotrichum spaethianum TaxID=700344 RepID=A0AA37NVG3_9PEZI|nr:U6 snRNA-associated Sm-like protein LSm1 [Colletotrichum spaethianum]GKT43237.1 U6 snRNA-associated Sm-like protein LSm1 [Colletotrichum spaethianum]